VRVGVVPIGFGDGLNHVPPLGRVLIQGKEAPVMGRRSLQHTVVDLTELPEANIGSVVTVLGEDGGEPITIDELADALNLPVLELLPRLARSLSHVQVM